MRRNKLLWLWLILIMTCSVLTSCKLLEHETLITDTYPAEGVPLSAFGWVGVTFSSPMVHRSVENAFSITPNVSGKTFWNEDTFWFRPITPFEIGTTYQARLSGDIQSINGQIEAVNQTWSFTIREPALLYFSPEGKGGELWLATANGDQRRPLTDTGGNVFDFAAGRSGSWIAFTAQNDIAGHDLWLLDPTDDESRLLLSCGQDICAEPAWSMDAATIAYTREIFNSDTGGFQAARVWTVDVHTGDTSQLYQSEFAYGHSPSFSPDGEKLATYDTSFQAIRILDLQTSQESAIPRVLPGSGDWSLDGKRLIFTDVVPAENEPFVDIIILNLDTQTLEPAFGETFTDTDFSQPRWSPNGKWIAVSLRPVNSGINKALWVLEIGGETMLPVADEPSANFSSYDWDPWGNQLVYQRLSLGSSDPLVSIWRWDWENQQSALIIENGARPQWLP